MSDSTRNSTRGRLCGMVGVIGYADCKSGISFHRLRWSMSCRATRRSTVFDNTDRFDIGLYDLQSAGSMSGFFISGVINADLNGVGNTPDDKDRLHSSVMNGASKSALSLRRRVGIGSLAHCLSGSLRMTAATSSMSSVWNVDGLQPGDAVVNDSGVSAVEARMPATLLSKNRCS